MYLINTAIVLALAFAGQNIQPEWQVDASATAADKDSILKLAREFGIDPPRLVSFESTLPSGCPFVRVESAIKENGYRRSWRELLLRNRKWRSCFEVPRRSIVKRAG